MADARAAVDTLPRYDLRLTLDTNLHRADFRMTVTWTNHHQRPTNEIAFNFYPQYRIPDGDHLLLAKTLELLRLNPSSGIDRAGRHGTIERVTIPAKTGEPTLLSFHYRHDNPSAIIVELPTAVNAGETVVVELEGTIRLPNKQGRWGHWQGVHYVSNALPVVAFYDEIGWHAMPFIPWHQPFWNEAGQYTATIRVPADQKIACSAGVQYESIAADGWKEIVTAPFVGRDFAVLASAEYVESASTIRLPSGREITLKCLAFPRHEHYAKEILKIVGEAIPAYSEWFGEFPYAQFTVAESFFGWNGNECSGLIMIDERVFGMPHLARGYVEYLVSHETCHQWWYNMIGTNGYAETFMDEGAATYFTHRLLDKKHGKNNAFLEWPDGLTWLPNINRENYRNASMYGAIRRNQMPAAAGELPGFNHLVGLFSGAYDRGSRVFGMIEAQLGETAFLDFMRDVTQKYSWRVLSAQQFKTELEAYTGRSQDEFFERWVYGKGITDWQIESVAGGSSVFDRAVTGVQPGPRRMEIIVAQTGDYNEPTTLGFQFADGDGFPIRIPLSATAATVRVAEQDVLIQPLPDNKVRVELTLPSEPSQICVDPDRVLIDRNPANNVWRQKPRFTLSPFYSMLNETDLTNDYDKWNFGGGPWIGGALFPDPWYTRSTMVGVRAGAYRTQIFSGGLYGAYRSDFRDLVIGADGLWDHWPLPKTQLGFNVEQRIAGPYGDVNGRNSATRASTFARYVWQYGSSLYLPPLAYTEVFQTYQDNFLPFARATPAGAVRPDSTYLAGLHTRVNLYTPYWDPECGFWVDATYGSGVARLDKDVGLHQLRLELAAVRRLSDSDCLGRLGQSRLAVRVVTEGAFPDRGQFFALGGSTLFRGYDLAERQGSALWVANAELRVPLARDVTWDVLDHVAGARNVWLAGFYDVGGVYSNGRVVKNVAHALGAGIRVDTALFSFIERVTLRFDVAKTINDNTPFQFWFGVQHAF
ncbi:M1 family aminopeptidase [Limnoglobus roseus]|uniref:M1 family aminopeptidase n=1 Tax=Limnoglobus roseus TaxID=2598579 RepID=UPI00143D4911|nr:M1 family aminopeptidase [Limnoglobus roseus]